MTTKPTEEEVEAARQIVAQADAEQEAATRAANLAAVQGLVDLGFGVDSPVVVPISDLVQGLRQQAPLMAISSDTTLMRLCDSTAQVLQTLNDRVRSIVALNREPETP